MHPGSDYHDPSTLDGPNYDQSDARASAITGSAVSSSGTIAGLEDGFPNVTGKRRPTHGPMSDFLTYLAFEGHGLRIGLELGWCMTLYAFLDSLLRWADPTSVENWHGLVAWFSACSFVVAFDQFFLCRPVYVFRNAYQLLLSGAYDEALRLLEHIAPERKALVRCPSHFFHLLRAEIFLASETYTAAELEIQRAEQAGADSTQVAVARSRLLRVEQNGEAFTHALEELERAEAAQGSSALLAVEKGLLHLEQRKDLWLAKKTLRAAAEMEDQAHFIGDFTSNIARGGYEAARLWTGEAEEGLTGITEAIDRLRSLAMHIDTLRPFLSWLLLERAHYLATHAEPEAACIDLRMGLALCNSPSSRNRARPVQDELEWRYQIIVPI